MTIQRRSLYGFPPPGAPQSVVTSRMIPLTQGLKPDTAWPLRPAGSAYSMTEFLPLEGKLVPRSRLSSLNTTVLIPGIEGVALMTYSLINGEGSLWISGDTLHGLVNSAGSISRASFISAFGLGSAALQSGGQGWSYAQVFSGILNENMLVAANNSGQSLVCLYRTGGSSGNAVYSFLTSAPPAAAVCTFDNYLVAFNIRGATNAATRVQWCVRGEPSNWTGEGAGFEDLLEMRGRGTAVRGSEDGRIYLFTTKEIWYGLRAAYPAQFQFYPYNSELGCTAWRTIQETPAGIVFLGNDRQIYLLPRGGGELQPIAPSLTPVLRTFPIIGSTEQPCWAVYDEKTHIYHLFMRSAVATTARGFVVNLGTGEWGYAYDNGILSDMGNGICARTGLANALQPEDMYFVSSEGTVYSTKSTLPADRPGSDSTATVTAIWQSTPLAADLPANYKQVTGIALDYRNASLSTVTLKLSTDGGNNYESTGQVMSLASAPYGGRVEAQTYAGGAFPTLQLESTSAMVELHRVEATFAIGGRR